MSYELNAVLRTLSSEGVGATARKMFQYVCQIGQTLRFISLSRPRGDNVEALVKFSRASAGGVICPQQVESEILQLACVVRDLQPKVVVEIGTANGGTLFLWATLMHPMGCVISIDLPGGTHGGGYPYWKTWLYNSFGRKRGDVRLLRGDSHASSMRKKLERILAGRAIDFLFIDGDHTYAGVVKDFEMYSPLVRLGGMIALHDICVHSPKIDCQVDKFWQHIKKDSNSMELIENADQGWAGIGLITM